MDAWKIIQDCELAPGTGMYNKEKFLQAVSAMTLEQFSRFCRGYLHLMEFHSLNQNTWSTDYTPLVEQYPDKFWKFKKIDFDAPVPFIRRE